MPNASSLFLLFSISENALLEIFSELHENLRGIFIRQDGVRDQRATPGRGPTRTRGWGSPRPLEVAFSPLDAYKFLFSLILTGR